MVALRLKVKPLSLEAGGRRIVILNESDASELGVRSLNRVSITYGSRNLIAIVNITKRFVDEGWIGTYEEVTSYLKLREGVEINVESAPPPLSIQHIREKLSGRTLDDKALYEIVHDIVHGYLSEVEIAAFVTALHLHGLSLEEAAGLSKAMVETGEVLELKRHPIVDKHSIGGVPGDKTTLIVVPVIASLGYVIPKTSSRAITSAAGTADRAEVLMPVDLTVNEIREVINKVNGCIVWGGALQLAPADDVFVRVEHPLSIDPLLLPSIMAKKKAVGAEYLVIDIPTGKGAKVMTMDEANILAKDFIRLGEFLKIKVKCAITQGEQPIGYSVGPALEAKEALEVLSGIRKVPDLLNKVAHIASILLEMVGVKNPYAKVLRVIEKGKAEAKLREIIEAQGGDPNVKPEEIPLGDHTYTVKAKRKGIILWIDNSKLVEIARSLGAPKDKGAGIRLYKKLGEPVNKGEAIFTLYAEKGYKLDYTLKLLTEESFIGIGNRTEMLLQKIEKAPPYTRAFILER